MGKSLVAASLAKSFATEGRKTLLVELGGSRFFEFVYGRPLSFEPQILEQNLSISLWEGEACLKEYLQHLLRFARVVDLFFDNRIMQALVHGAPGLKELALMGKITSQERHVGPEMAFDELVIDSYSTGHFKALLAAPQAMAKAISFGPMGSQSESIHRVLTDSRLCEFLVTVVPEELPMTEGLELAQHIQSEFGQSPKIVKNRWWPSLNQSENLPLDFLEKWKNQMELQKFDFMSFKTKAVLPQIWSHSNLEKIQKLSHLWKVSQ